MSSNSYLPGSSQNCMYLCNNNIENKSDLSCTKWIDLSRSLMSVYRFIYYVKIIFHCFNCRWMIFPQSVCVCVSILSYLSFWNTQQHSIIMQKRDEFKKFCLYLIISKGFWVFYVQKFVLCINKRFIGVCAFIYNVLRREDYFEWISTRV